jgi:hypothetical protein
MQRLDKIKSHFLKKLVTIAVIKFHNLMSLAASPIALLTLKIGENGHCSSLQQFLHPLPQNADRLTPPPSGISLLSHITTGESRHATYFLSASVKAG